MNRLFLLALALALALTLPAASAQTVAAHVPFVGCKSDGQTGPLAAPHGQPKLVHGDAMIVQRLAYYKAEYSPGVLAPRDWYCFSTYGSNGASIYVSPQRLTPEMFFSDKTWKGFDGPVIQLSDMSGGTSGRFSVARTIARVFPAHRQFARDVIKEGLEPAKDFPFGPYPTDKLAYKSKEMVEFETPAGSDGLGTASWLLKNDSPIKGVAILSGADTDCVTLSARLPSNLSDLTPAIIHQVEFDTTHATN